jgi:hypothetical protein
MLLEMNFLGDYGVTIFHSVLAIAAVLALFISYGPITYTKRIHKMNRERQLNIWRREINGFMAQCERLIQDSKDHGAAAARDALRKRASGLRANLDDNDKAQALLSNRIAVCTRVAILASNEAGKLQSAFDLTRRAATTVLTNGNRLAVQKMGRV